VVRSGLKSKRSARATAAKKRQGGSSSPRKRKSPYAQLGLCGVALVAVGLAVASSIDTSPRRITGSGQVPTASPLLQPIAARPVKLAEYDIEPQSINELLDLPKEELHRVDIARMNLLCASRLPGTESLDIDQALAQLDEWAKKVAAETDRHLYRVSDPRYAKHYNNSEAQFRAEMLAQVLQEDLGVKYDMSSVGNFSFTDPTVAFIHGMIPTKGKTTADTPGGTCASMPVLYVAVGRRLGYPLKLTTTDSHIFARWEGLNHSNPAWRGRFNCETTNGFSVLPDDYYRTWPKPVTEHEVAANGFLKSLTPAQEMAQFMAARGHHGVDVGEISFAARCYENAYRADMRQPAYLSWFMDAAMASGLPG